MKSIKENLKKELFPLYVQLLEKNTHKDICTFCVQWGDNFPINKNEGILFVGKAVNGWITDNTDPYVLFGDTEESIFGREDQMKWVNETAGSENDYNSNKSAFWRLVRTISYKFHPNENSLNHVAWSNLCKVAPFKGGNPNDSLYYEQLELSQQILSKEMEHLSPKVVIMLTSNWEKDFLFHLNHNVTPEPIEVINWNGYETKLYNIYGTNIITSVHPQSKNETLHAEAIIKLIEKCN